MLALASQAVKDQPRLRRFLLVIGIFGTCLFYGDGVITPAISVLGAMEGLEVVSPQFKRFVVPLTLVVMFLLFSVQKRGTAGIGKFFGPITLVWFAVLAILGVVHIVDNPVILKALSPHYALMFIWNNPGITFILLGAVVLCVTGAEALYADLGHFGKKPFGLVQCSDAVAHPQLLWPRGAAATKSAGGKKSVLHDGAELGLGAIGHTGHYGRSDSVAGAHYRSL